MQRRERNRCATASVFRLGLLFLLISISPISAAPTQTLNANLIIAQLERNYGPRAGKRANAWFNTMKSAENMSERDKLTKVNRFFNLFTFIDDIKLWGESNYWATPLEFIGVSGGDCEDFSIAKYFTLLHVGVPEDKLRITMVKAKTVDQYHMVLTYYETPGSVPLVLDNLDPQIKPATQRRDLVPVYSFNGKQLWLNKQKGRGELAGSAKRLKKWNDLTHRLEVDRLRQPKIRLE